MIAHRIDEMIRAVVAWAYLPAIAVLVIAALAAAHRVD